MITRDDVVAEARRWLKTPYQHQRHQRGVATDCAGVIGGVALALGLVPEDFWETQFMEHAGYGRQPALGQLERVCDAFMERGDVAAAAPGDVAAFRFRRETMHLGILVPYVHGGLALVHALSTAKEVVEHRLDSRWQDRLTVVWHLPGVA